MPEKETQGTISIQGLEAIQHREEKRSVWHWVFHFFSLLAIVGLAVLLMLNGQKSQQRLADLNQKWLDYISEYDFADYSYTQDGKGLNILGDGNGVEWYEPAFESESQNQEE
jgi:hypothetical protein